MDSKFGAKLFGTDGSVERNPTSKPNPDSTEVQTRTEEEVSQILTEGSTKNQSLSVIGKTLVFKGELSAAEDILIQGNIQGTIKHNSTNLTVGAHGKVDADIDATNVIVQGTVNGDIRAEKSIIIEPSARVQGNLFAPIIGVKEGAKFKGTIDMEVAGSTSANDTKSQQKPANVKDPSTSKTAEASDASVDAILNPSTK